MIEIIEAGFKTTIQDMGRLGHYHEGVPPAGAADKFSYIYGNLLLKNPLKAAAMEMTFQGGKMIFHKRTIAVVTGAPTKVLLNDKEIPMWTVFAIEQGDTLAIGQIKAGVFSYLLVSGGFDVPEVLQSKSTCLASVFPGITGRLLAKQDKIPIAEALPGAHDHIGNRLAADVIPVFKQTETIHIVLGITCDLISDEGLVSFLNNYWTIQPSSNRTASMMKGGHLRYKEIEQPFGAGGMPGNIVDIPYPIGAVIVPNEQEIITLLNDGTGGGGFASIGTIIWSDVSKLSQMRPYSKVKFQAITVEQAIEMRESKREEIEQIKQQIIK